MSTINNEIYNQIHDTWWNTDGFMAMLRTSVNPPRFEYFKNILLGKLALNPQQLTVLDVGCGGGFLAEQFAAIGCTVTGIDRSQPTLAAARAHAQESGLAITYLEGSGEHLPFENRQFDIVCCCDVLEHVDNYNDVIAEISRVLKPGGIFFYDTINRTLKSKLVAIKMAQEWRLTKFMPEDVHVWDKFIRPHELATSLQKNNLSNANMAGLALKLNPAYALFHFVRQKLGKLSFAALGSKLVLGESKDMDISYMGFAVRSISS
jgi:2-polyprenyl-6-hydroxyphenyl methylase / 3-demethylubiquinone-9 3-methyltransferase